LNKKNFILILFSITIFLLFFNILLDKISRNVVNDNSVLEMSRAQIDSIFADIFNDYGFENEWIKKVNISKSENDIDYIFRINFPNSIEIPIFLADLQSRYDDNLVSIETDELNFSGKTRINIFSNNRLKFQAFLTPSSGLKRNVSTYSFILSNMEDLTDDNLKRIDNFPIPISLLISPSENLDNIVKNLKEYKNISYSIILNDEIESSKYNIRNSIEKSRIKGTVFSICKNYSGAKAIFYDQKSSLANSVGFSFIKNEFNRHGRTIWSFSKLKNYTDIDDEEIGSLFNYLHESNKNKEPLLIRITFPKLTNLLDDIKSYKKMGDKFIQFKENLIQ